MTKSSSGKVPKPSLPRSKKKGRDAANAPPPADDETSRLLIDADSFLRLGLVDKAIEHLAGAVRRDPSLRGLREPLVRLYVSQRQYKRALDELWALISPCDDPKDEIRFLRYILRLGGKDPAAEKRLATILAREALLAVGASSDDATEQKGPVTDLGGELRAYLGRHRPPTDRTPTRDFSRSAPPDDSDDAPLPASAVTRPSTDEVEAVAEEIALSSGGLKEQLQEIDDCLRGLRHVEALKRLRALAVRYPHSKRVRDKLQLLEQMLSQAHIDDEPTPGYTNKKESLPDINTATTLPHWAMKAVLKKPTLPPDGSAQMLRRRHTIEVDPADIKEERRLPPPAPQPRSASPPPQPSPPQPSPSQPPRSTGSMKRPGFISDAERAIRTGTTMRSFGQLKQAIQVFEQAQKDPDHGPAAALMAGLCYRDLGRHREALASFTRGVNMRNANESMLSELFYELGYTHELLSHAAEAILFYELSLGKAGAYRDAEERIATLHNVFGAP